MILIQHYCSTVTKQKLKVATVSMANHSGNTIAEARKNRNKVGSCELKLAEEKTAKAIDQTNATSTVANVRAHRKRNVLTVLANSLQLFLHRHRWEV